MNNDELKKKIVEVLKPVIRAGNISCNEENACKKCWFPCEIERTAGRLADALIAAGIGDLKEHRIFAGKDGSIKQLYSGEEVEKIVKERKELKDELRSKVEYIHEQGEVIKEYKHRAEVAELVVKNLNDIFTFDYQTVFEQAEKELAEESNVKN